MTRFSRRRDKRRLLGRLRSRPVRYIGIAPALVTMLNGILGFVSIVLASKVPSRPGLASGYIELAAYMVLAAMVADVLDGSLARISRTTSSFGAQLDSLCDLISFGIAPAFLMLQLVHQGLSIQGIGHRTLFERFLLLAVICYICCACIRLARFNVEHLANHVEHSKFTGLPSPAAAGVLVSLTIFHIDVLPEQKGLLYLLPVAALVSALLMVSRVPYPHVVNQYIAGRKPFGHLIKVLAFLALVLVAKPASALMVVFWGFAMASPIRHLYNMLIRKAATQTAEQAQIGPEHACPSPGLQ